MVAALAACGGKDDEPGAPGAATVGAAGGTLRSEDGAQVVFPKGALRDDVTVRIAKDSTGAPPLPAAAVAVGAVYAITPHGGGFEDLVEVSIPVEQPDAASEGQLLLITADPGDSQWRVLSGAEYYDGKMRARVMRFSFFRTIRLVNQIMPTLVTRIDGANNISGANRISPLANLPTAGVNSLLAELSFPTPLAHPGAVRGGVPLAAPVATTCRPVDLGHGAMSVRFTRERTEVFSPAIDHPAVVVPEPWPRYPGDGGALTFKSYDTTAGGNFPGLGAVHYYGNESPRIFGLYDANPPTQAQIDAVAATQSRTHPPPLTLPVGNVYALPPASDNTGDNLYTWHGTVYWSATQNGSVRVDAAIMTTCGLLLEATPIAFKLALPPAAGYLARSVFPALIDPSSTDVAEGADVTMHFGMVESGRPGSWSPDDTGITYRVDYSPDPTQIDWQPVPTAAVSRVQFQMWNNDYRVSALYLNVAGVRVFLPAVQQSQAGHYRVFWCDTPGCFNSQAAILAVRRAPPTITSQPPGQTVQVGETASFTVATAGAPVPALQWQKRSLLAAAFGFAAWTTIDGATGSTYTTPALALGDTATQYRVWATNAVGSVASEIAMLTVVERYLPPVVVAQPGNLNVTVGGTAVFAATVSGPGPLSYQWRRNGVNITGANSAILTLGNVTALNDGRYELVVTNRAGSVTTEPGLLQVTLGTPVPLAPAIAAPPASITVAEGNAANFAVAVTGTGPYLYQWFKAGAQAPIPNSDFPSFSIAAVTAADAGAYSVRVTNNVGQVLSAAATLTVVPASGVTLPPAITTAPVALAVQPGGGATFAVAATGTAPLSYQWRRNGADIAGATGAVLHFAAVNALDGGHYAVEVRNAVGLASSAAVPLIVIGAPAIVLQPAAVSATQGNTATLSVTASGDGLLYLWMRNGIAIPGATAASHTTAALALADSGAVYTVAVYNGAGLVFSQGAVLSVNPAVIAPSVTLQPVDSTVADATPANLDVAFGGTAPFGVQPQRFVSGAWVSYGSAVTVNDNNMVRFSTGNLSAAGGPYVLRYVASNAAASVATNAVTVTVTAPPTLTATTLASAVAGGVAPNNRSTTPSLSADGLLVAFRSDGTNLVAGVTGAGHAYLRNLATNTTALINARPDGGESARGVTGLKLSANGRHAVFTSLANDLVAGDTNVADDVFLRDLVTGTTTRLNVLPSGAQDVVSGNAIGGQIDISADGRWVLMSSGVNLAGDGAALPNGYALFLRDTVNGATRAVPGLAGYGAASLSASGLCLVVATGTAGFNHLQVYDVAANSTLTAFSVRTDNFPDGIGGTPSISDDCQVIAFGLRSSSLPDFSTHNQIAVFDRGAAAEFELQLQSQTSGEAVGNYHSSNAVVSGDGRYVLFSTNAPNLTGDTAATIRPYLVVRDRLLLLTTVASRRVDGSNVWVGNFGHALSRDGTALASVADMANVFIPARLGEYQVFVAPRP